MSGYFDDDLRVVDDLKIIGNLVSGEGIIGNSNRNSRFRLEIGLASSLLAPVGIARGPILYLGFFQDLLCIIYLKNQVYFT